MPQYLLDELRIITLGERVEIAIVPVLAIVTAEVFQIGFPRDIMAHTSEMEARLVVKQYWCLIVSPLIVWDLGQYLILEEAKAFTLGSRRLENNDRPIAVSISEEIESSSEIIVRLFLLRLVISFVGVSEEDECLSLILVISN